MRDTRWSESEISAKLGLSIAVFREPIEERHLAQIREAGIKVVDDVGADRFGMIVDIGHTRDLDGINPFVKRDVARQTLAKCGSRVFHVHLHETFNLDKKPDHRPPKHKEGSTLCAWARNYRLGTVDC
jgi:sugar phosphate isomerase/epimerase